MEALLLQLKLSKHPSTPSCLDEESLLWNAFLDSHIELLDSRRKSTNLQFPQTELNKTYLLYLKNHISFEEEDKPQVLLRT